LTPYLPSFRGAKNYVPIDPLSRVTLNLYLLPAATNQPTTPGAGCAIKLLFRLAARLHFHVPPPPHPSRRPLQSDLLIGSANGRTVLAEKGQADAEDRAEKRRRAVRRRSAGSKGGLKRGEERVRGDDESRRGRRVVIIRAAGEVFASPSPGEPWLSLPVSLFLSSFLARVSFPRFRDFPRFPRNIFSVRRGTCRSFSHKRKEKDAYTIRRRRRRRRRRRASS